MLSLRHSLVALIGLLTTACAASPAEVQSTTQVQPGEGRHWLQPEGHTDATLAAAYADGILDEKDPIYWIGDEPVRRWEASSRRPGKAGRHGYRQGFTDIEVFVVEANSWVTEQATGKLPYQYGMPILNEILRPADPKNPPRAWPAPCDAVHSIFSEVGWMPPGFYPTRNIRGQPSGSTKMIVKATYAQTVVPLHNGFVTVVMSNRPFEHQDNAALNPTVGFQVYHQGRPVRQMFLPAGNTDGMLWSIPENPGRGYKNDLKDGVQKGGKIFVVIVPPQACR